MRGLTLALLLAAISVDAQTTHAEVVRSDSLLESAIHRVGYDRFLNRTYSPELIVPSGTPNAGRIVRAWEDVYTPRWYAQEVRTQALAAVTTDDLRALLRWLDEPVVRRAIAHDFDAAHDEDVEGWTRLAEARAAGGLDPQFEAAVTRIVEVTRGGEAALEYGIRRYEAFLLYAADSQPGATRPTRSEIEQFRRMARQQMRDVTSEDVFAMIASRFESFPLDDLVRYAELLDSPEGRTYIGLVFDAPYAANLEAVHIALEKARK
ncbi:MAG: hypothetical protein AAF845_14495 [Bacteroidota bacterium]